MKNIKIRINDPFILLIDKCEFKFKIYGDAEMMDDGLDESVDGEKIHSYSFLLGKQGTATIEMRYFLHR